MYKPMTVGKIKEALRNIPDDYSFTITFLKLSDTQYDYDKLDDFDLSGTGESHDSNKCTLWIEDESVRFRIEVE